MITYEVVRYNGDKFVPAGSYQSLSGLERGHSIIVNNQWVKVMWATAVKAYVKFD